MLASIRNFQDIQVTGAIVLSQLYVNEYITTSALTLETNQILFSMKEVVCDCNILVLG